MKYSELGKVTYLIRLCFSSYPQMMYRFSPKRSELFGKDADLEENIKALEDFIGPLQANVRQVHDFYTLHDLHCLKKV